MRELDPVARFQRHIFGKTALEANVKGQCVTCPEPDLSFASEKESREYTISGMCARCQREVFNAAAE